MHVFSKLFQALLVCLILANAASASVEYTVTDLGTVGGSVSQAKDINNSGQVVGDSAYDPLNSNPLHGFIWQSGTITDIGTLGGSVSSARAINASGKVAGYAYTATSYGPHPVTYQSGVMSDLLDITNDYISGNAYTINDSGVVAGNASIDYNGAYPFTNSGGTMTYITTEHFNVAGINASGEISCMYSKLYKDGTTYSIPTFGGTYSMCGKINILGQIVGSSDITGDAHSRAFLWTPETPFATTGKLKDLGTLASGLDSNAIGINAWGTIVGSSRITATGYNTHAFIYKCSMQDLNDLISSTSGWTLLIASAINDKGQIVGTGTNPDGKTHAFLLTPL